MTSDETRLRRTELAAAVAVAERCHGVGSPEAVEARAAYDAAYKDVARTADGQYTFSTMAHPCRDWEHTAARVKTPNGTFQDCLVDGCDCNCFRKVPKRA